MTTTGGSKWILIAFSGIVLPICRRGRQNKSASAAGEQLCLQMSMLDNERENIARPLTGQREREYKKIGVAKTEIAAQLTKINERVKYLRKLQTMLQWKEAVRVLFGQDAFDECVIFIEQRYQHLEDTRHEWA